METPRKLPLVVSVRIADPAFASWVEDERSRFGISYGDVLKIAAKEKYERTRPLSEGAAA